MPWEWWRTGVLVASVTVSYPMRLPGAGHSAKGGKDLTPAAVEAGKGKYNAKLLEAIDWAMAVDEEDRPQSADAWRQGHCPGMHGGKVRLSLLENPLLKRPWA